MKAFLMGVAAAAVVGVAAYFGLNTLGWNSAQYYSTDAVRLSPDMIPSPNGVIADQD
jgi:hypothetical protein